MAKKQKNFEYEFDPVKHAKDGKEAEKVIWTTSVLNNAVKAINEGLPLKANPFIGKNTKLLKPDLVYKRTEEEIEDYIKCMQDPIHFASKCYIMTPTGLQSCVLRDYQINYIKHLQNNKFSIFLACRQAGKCFSYTTKIVIKKYWGESKQSLEKYKISEDIYELPIFELYNLYHDSIIWKLKYKLYKLIYKLNNDK
jgi:hypothetical protein